MLHRGFCLHRAQAAPLGPDIRQVQGVPRPLCPALGWPQQL